MKFSYKSDPLAGFYNLVAFGCKIVLPDLFQYFWPIRARKGVNSIPVREIPITRRDKMNHDEVLDIDNTVESAAWMGKLRQCRAELPAWVSNFHPEKLPCKLLHEKPENDRRGSYNWVIQFVFTSGEEWIVRFPKGSKVRYPVEKVEAEVSTLELLRDKTDIPVPEVKGWGLASENKFGLGPFMILNVIKGVDLGSILRTSDSTTRLMREDIGDEVVAKVYRQVARFML